MAGLYETQWTMRAGESPIGPGGSLTEFAERWVAVLLHNETKIAVGIAGMKRMALADLKAGKRAWPPTPIEFQALCDGALEPDAAWSTTTSEETLKVLAAPRANPGVAREHLTSLRRMMGWRVA